MSLFELPILPTLGAATAGGCASGGCSSGGCGTGGCGTAPAERTSENSRREFL